MECLSSSRELSDYLNGRGTEQERREVHRHLSSCPRCADQAEDADARNVIVFCTQSYGAFALGLPGLYEYIITLMRSTAAPIAG